MTTTPVMQDAVDDEDILHIDDAGIIDPDCPDSSPKAFRRQFNWLRIIAYGLIPAVAFMLTLGAGYLKWLDSTNRDSQTARAASVQAARDSTIALLSYTPGDVDQRLVAARDLLTGDFRNAYTSLTNDVVIPGAKQQQITAVATVPAAASVSAGIDQAVVMVFVDQTTTVGSAAPTKLASMVRVGLDKVHGRWLISQFDPV